MASESTKPQDSSQAEETPEPAPSAENPPKPHDPTAKGETAATDAVAGPQEKRPTSAPPQTPAVMPVHIFVLAATYLVALIAVFVVYVTWPSFRSHIPASFGQLPVGIVWFGATGAVIASLYGIFVHNKSWDSSYNYWHYCRPIFGAVTGSVGALIYLILLNLGSKSAIKVDSLTFYVVAFVLGFADKSFIQMLQNVTNVIIKPGNKTSPVNPKGSSNDGSNTPSDG
ncbi:MAG TPA: hypothetical protein VNO25_05940 [Streptosporangiaceae bacterium]|jgi:hypothetical protein|nr:hypothetical protein [Streptosporangiaceae bacterium]